MLWWKKCMILGGCDLTLPFCPLSCSRVTEVLTISGWKKKQSHQTVQVHSVVHELFIYFVTCSLLLSMTMMVFVFILLLYVYESININKLKVLDYKEEHLGLLLFFVLNFPWILVATLWSAFLYFFFSFWETLNVFQKKFFTVKMESLNTGY